ncbi:MAG: heavy-metal-associated domain-containing protein [Bacteroidales bacterium]|nr:heavy-metal-associated domain-containing protein [Bacteroidales bacterium]MCF6342228.1 heavy-metal-associated domain-containing protein [Bacteroidales bacterium]
MKKNVSLVLAMMFLGFFSLSAQVSKTEKFKVYGECGSCENRIEKAVKSVEGVSAADWDKETKMIEVSFDESKTDLKKVQSAITSVGHDTESYKAKDEAYYNLPGCCQYSRSKEGETQHQGHKH